jgi:alpha-beta hydrolase superfamily lysophospholipase
VIERHTVSVAAETLSLVLHPAAGDGAAPCVVACHGLHASKDSDKYLLLGEAFPASGLALARFDFRGCGESSGTESETTVTTRLADLDAVLARLAGHPRLDGRFGLLGSSLGGFVALHAAARRGDGLPVVTWNAPAVLKELDDPEDGLGPAFRAEVQAGGHAEAPHGVANHLVIQAGRDEVVPVEQGRELHRRATAPRGWLLIPAADHRLTESPDRARAVAASLEWFRRFLLSGPAARGIS